MDIKVKGALFSEDRKYRYRLWRKWDTAKPCILWIMNNPSIADDQFDDPTIRRVVKFSQSWGYGGVYIGNLSPYRATNPKELQSISFSELCPINNIIHINEMKQKCTEFVLAYGNPIIKDCIPRPTDPIDNCWKALKLTKQGNPSHPLYIKSDTKLQSYNILREEFNR